jgi:hypothetical protein
MGSGMDIFSREWLLRQEANPVLSRMSSFSKGIVGIYRKSGGAQPVRKQTAEDRRKG